MSPVLYPPVYTLRLELLEIEPSIWRRIQVPGSFTLADVHDVIQLVMGWEDSHMHHGRAPKNAALQEQDPRFRRELSGLT